MYKIIFLLFSLFLYQVEVFADDVSVDTSEGVYIDIDHDKATGPECMLDSSSILALILSIHGGIISLEAGMKLVIKGAVLLSLPDPTTISKTEAAAAFALGGAGIAGGIASLTYAALIGTGFGVCAGSFVRDPMLYFPSTSKLDGQGAFPKDWEGRMMKQIRIQGTPIPKYRPISPGNSDGINCADEKDCYFLGKRASRAHKIIVCARSLIPVGVFSIEGCYKNTTRRGWITFVGKDVFSGGRDNDYYDGPKSLLCPEEFRQVWRMPRDPDSSGYRKLGCNRGDLKDCLKNHTTKNYVNPAFKKNSSLENYKLTFGRPACEEGRKSRTSGKWLPVYINGYKYTIAQYGVNLCATLVGLGEMPSPQQYKIGCIKTTTSNAMPKCSRSIPIYENYTTNSDGMIDYYGDELGSGGIVLRYDDTACGNSCALSALCQSVGGTKFLHAPIPITSYLMGCFRESLNQITYGCNSPLNINNSTNSNEGMLYTVQKRMRVIIILAIMLSIILFGIQIVLGDNVVSLKEISIFFLKIILVIYLTTTHSSGDNGMAKYIGYIDKISASLQAMVLHSVTKNGLCSAIESATYQVDIPGNGKKDLNYLRVWDLLDCKFAFYFSSGFSNKIGNSSYTDPYDRPLFYQITAILSIPFRFIIAYLALAFFCIFLIFTIMQICELVICAFLAFSILTVVSPIFVPFILFKSQKQVFDSWVNQVFAYSLYPVLIFAFMGFLFISMDKLIFGDTIFVPVESFMDGRKITSYAVSDSKDFSATAECNGFTVASSASIQEIGDIPVGCDCAGTHCMLNASIISSKSSGKFFGKTTGATLKISTQKGEDRFVVGSLGLMFIMFIYYQLTKEIYGLLNALSGSMRSIIMHQATTATQRMEGAGTIALGLLRSKGKKKGEGEGLPKAETSTGAKSEGAKRSGLPSLETNSSKNVGDKKTSRE